MAIVIHVNVCGAVAVDPGEQDGGKNVAGVDVDRLLMIVKIMLNSLLDVTKTA